MNDYPSSKKCSLGGHSAGVFILGAPSQGWSGEAQSQPTALPVSTMIVVRAGQVGRFALICRNPVLLALCPNPNALSSRAVLMPEAFWTTL